MTLKERREKTEELCKIVAEVSNQVGHDLSGEQREFYVPKLMQLFVLAGTLFPAEMARGLQQAKTPWGDTILKE